MKKIIAFAFTLAMLSTARSQQKKPVTDYLNYPGPISINNLSYNLAWSSHPSANFYKQEYLVKGDKPEKYKSMVMVDVITGATNIKEIVAAKLAELKQMKETNPMVNYESFDNPTTGEYLVDFLLSANDANGKLSIVERNVYRYKLVTTKQGQKAILLFAVSTRAYGNEIDGFLLGLKKTKKDLVNAVAKFNMPPISIVN